VLDRVDMHIAGIGHTGKDERRGERGSNARLADVDVLVQITGDIVKTVTVMKGNDQPEGVLTGFQLEPLNLDTDEDGDPVRVFIVGKEIFAGAALTERPLSDRQKLGLEALAETVLVCGRDAPADYELPRGIKVVSDEAWKTELLCRKVLDPARNPRARFTELRNALAARKLIGNRDDLVWLVRPV
jgi:hypothetical protein